MIIKTKHMGKKMSTKRKSQKITKIMLIMKFMFGEVLHLSIISLFLDDSHGQLGLCDLFPEKLITIPKTCSFNVVIKSISCGLSHTCFVSD